MAPSLFKKINMKAGKTSNEEKIDGQPIENHDNGSDSSDQEEEDESSYPPFKVVLPTMISIYLATFLVSLDRTIIGTAIPIISNEFNSFGDIGWYEAAYLLTFCTLQLPMGRLYRYFPAKWIFIGIVAIFEIGSAVCASAPNSNAFIVGRAIAGIGGAGCFVGATVIVANILPLRKRPKYLGLLGACFGAASVLGPTLGGVFTTKVTWRWCFWINLPIGGTGLVMLLFILPPIPPSVDIKEETLVQKLWKFDPIGTALLIPSLICLLFALQFGGTKYPWNSATVIALFVVGGVLGIAFIVSQGFIGEDATIPPRIFLQRSILSGTIVTFGFGSAMVILALYVPIWFQAIRGLSAYESGLRMIGFFLCTVLFVISSGILISKVGQYAPFLIVGSAIFTAGTASFTTLNPHSPRAQWIGLEVLTGAGLGLTLQQPQIAAQAVLSKRDIPIGATVLNFVQFFGGSVLVAACQTLLTNELSSGLAEKLPGFNSAAIATTGATHLRKLVPAKDLPVLLEVYNEAIDHIFALAAGLCGLAFLGSLFMEWRSVKGMKKDEAGAAAA